MPDTHPTNVGRLVEVLRCLHCARPAGPCQPIFISPSVSAAIGFARSQSRMIAVPRVPAGDSPAISVRWPGNDGMTGDFETMHSDPRNRKPLPPDPNRPEEGFPPGNDGMTGDFGTMPCWRSPAQEPLPPDPSRLERRFPLGQDDGMTGDFGTICRDPGPGRPRRTPPPRSCPRPPRSRSSPESARRVSFCRTIPYKIFTAPAHQYLTLWHSRFILGLY